MGSVAKILLVLVAIIAFIELAVALNMEITAEPMQCTAGESVNITARVLNNSIPQNNTLVNFTTTFGYLSALSAYTNGSGMAVVWINSTTSGNATINASVESAYNTTNVSFIPDAPTTIAINVSQNPLVAGNTTEVNLTSYDQYHNVNSTTSLTINILIANVLGETVHEINITRAPYTLTELVANQTDVTLTDSVINSSSVLLSINSTVAGNIIITANTGAVTNNTNITFTPAISHTISALYDDAYTVNTTSSITVCIYDIYENPVNNVTVLFNATSPPDTKYNSPIEYNSLQLTPLSSTTGPDGLTSTLFRTDKRAGDNTINITVMNTSINTTITINGLRDTADDIHLTHKPDQTYANNADAYSLSAQVVDKFQNPVLPTSSPIIDLMLFTTASGSTLIPLNENGTATTLAGPTSYIETITITATYKNETGYTNLTNTTNLTFVRGDLASFIFYTNPTAVLTQDISGNHNSTLALIALDEWGHALPNISVTLNNTNTSLGNITVTGINTTNLINTSTDSDGRINAVFTSKSLPGNATITATNNLINASTIVEIKDQPFLSVEITAEPATLNSGDIVNVTTIISVEGELPITRPAASAMLVLDRSGSMDPDYYAGTPLDVVLVLDRSGSMEFDNPYPQQPMTDAKTAAKVFMDNLVSNAQVGVVSFESSSRTDIGLTRLNSRDNKMLIEHAIDVIYANGGTAMGDGMADANTLLLNGRAGARGIMIVLTDGVWNAGSDPQNAVDIAKANGITIYTIGLGNQLDEPLLQRIASEAGGIYYNAPTSSELQTIYNAIAQDITDYDVTERQYGVDGFTPYATTNGSVQLVPVYRLSFEGYDFDTTFSYNGETLGEALLKVNGEELINIPPPLGQNEQWMDYEYIITDYVVNGSNIVSLYDYHDLLGLGGWTNNVRNVSIYRNDSLLQNYSAVQSLTATAYTCNFTTSITQDVFSYNFHVNNTVNDLKAEVSWSDPGSDLDLQLTSPSGQIYGFNGNTTGHYPNNTSEYVWVAPLSDNYPDSDTETIETGNWTVNITGKGSAATANFTVSIYIDKKSAVKTASHAFLSSFDETRGDKAGLVLYSNDNVVNTNVQTSYLRNDSTWSGYFTVDTDGIYNLNLSWDDASDLDLYLYEGATLLDSSTGSSKPEAVSSSLFAGTNYHVVASKVSGTENGTEFTINVSSSPIRTAICGYYDSTGGGGVPRYRSWDVAHWSDESSANFVDGSIRWIVMESCPTRDEVIMGTLDSYRDINIQLWDGSAWSAVQEFSRNAYDRRRGFDIAYEDNSGDAVVVYRNSDIDNSVPRYRVWDGTAWSAEGAVNATDAGNRYIQWVRLVAKPDTDELMLVFLNSDYDLRAQIWDGSAWSNVEVLTTSGRTYSYQCFDAVYEQGTGNGMVVWAQSDNTVRYAIWDGTSWSTPVTIYTDTASPYWIKLASDPNSNNILMSVLNSGKDVRVSAWNGTAWSSVLKIEEDTYEYNKRIMDVAFDQSNGNGMVVWGDSTPTPKYRIWNGSWGPENSASNLGGTGYTRWVHLSPNPYSDEIFLITSDGNSDINIQQWDGDGWNVPYEAETSSSRNDECFDLAYQRHNVSNVSITYTPVSWTEWRATVTSTLNNDSLIHLNNSIDTITADGLTAIDEGIYIANNELAGVTGNSTMVLMTDGLDNAGYHSLLLEAQHARNNNTVIYTIGFGNSKSEIDPVLSEIANITGGKYYYAPNASVLEDIFRGIAASITNFTAEGPVLSIHVPHNYITNLSVATATYIPNSSNATTGNAVSFITPTYPNTGNAEPNTTIVGNEGILLWTLPNLNPGEKWGVWYQLTVQGAGFVPLILPTSTVTYTDVNGTSITININYGGGSSIGGSAADVDYLALGSVQMNVNPPVILIGGSSTITLTATYDDNNPAVAYVLLYTNLGYFNSYQNPVNITISGSDTVNFRSATAGRAYINAAAYNANNIVTDNATIVVNPKGQITIS